MVRGRPENVKESQERKKREKKREKKKEKKGSSKKVQKGLPCRELNPGLTGESGIS